MTWLLAMKALLAGEISPDQFGGPQYAMTTSEECESPSGPELNELPLGLRSLLERSHALYVRIQRLDAMVREKLDAGEVPNFANSGWRSRHCERWHFGSVIGDILPNRPMGLVSFCHFMVTPSFQGN